MLAEQSLLSAQLSDALSQLQDSVRKDPANVKYRIFLFQLLAIMGQRERALNQLNVLGNMDAGTLPMVQTYRTALQCEVLRREVFAGTRSPLIFGQPQPWLAQLIEALQLQAQGELTAAQRLREQALAAAPSSSGTINEQRFDWLGDADLRLGPVLEAIVNGNYYWIPLQHVSRVALEPPSDLRDLVWMPAEFTWSNGGQTVGLIPTRYVGSEDAADDLIKLARKTTWTSAGEDTAHNTNDPADALTGLQIGLGQRLLATDQDDYPLLDVRTLQFDTPVADDNHGEQQPVSDHAAEGGSDRG